MKIKITAIIILAFLFVFTADLQAVDNPGGVESTERFVKARRPVRGEYIVVLDDSVRQADLERNADKLAASHGGKISAYYKYALKGFAVSMSEAAALRLSRHPLVRFVEENGIEEPPSGFVTQTPTPNWGLDRIDQFSLPLNNKFTRDGDGSGVHIFIVDTGINTSHNEFKDNNGVSRIDFANSARFSDGSGGIEDCNGHGTAVASIAAGRLYGVAKNAILHVVNIGSCLGVSTTTWKVNGLNYVAGKTQLRPAVANYSWNNLAAGNTSIGIAATGVINSGVALVNSAGNNNADASAYTPTYLSQVIVAGATDASDTRSIWTFPPDQTQYASNYGSVVDVFAPGINVLGAGLGSATATAVRSGTSFAAPHVTGAAALYLQFNPTAAPAAVQQHIVNKATPNKVLNVPAGTTRGMLYIGPSLITSP